VAENEYAGIPMPLDGHNLVIEPKYARGRDIMEEMNTYEAPPEGISIRNHFWSSKLQAELYICNVEGSDKVRAYVVPFNEKVSMLVNTMDCSYVWGLEQEYNAMQLLGTLVKHHQLKMYILTGMLPVRSQRSGLMYIFRRLKPTIVISQRGGTQRCIAALCLHSIGYYEGTWAGVMCPTDEVIAHLQLMRADEHYYWRCSNQHAIKSPQAGI
jgi:hypothetical protein